MQIVTKKVTQDVVAPLSNVRIVTKKGIFFATVQQLYVGIAIKKGKSEKIVSGPLAEIPPPTLHPQGRVVVANRSAGVIGLCPPKKGGRKEAADPQPRWAARSSVALSNYWDPLQSGKSPDKKKSKDFDPVSVTKVHRTTIKPQSPPEVGKPTSGGVDINVHTRYKCSYPPQDEIISPGVRLKNPSRRQKCHNFW